MGMFDDFKCSTDIGVLTNLNCQTKDIDRFAGGTMSFYWVDPSGQMWSPDYSGTTDFLMDGKKIKYISNGNHGKLRPVYITDYVEVYTSITQPDGLVDWYTCRLHFIEGKLVSYMYK